ncbi:C40 family peptidase [Salipiger mucosus]|uniref:NlpC/P60 domain-containing protein n=1 Tax=Salipiger mucosus DSM 16094 TaxID=1123237 RepID=S9QL14_9RHOB|nr:NlpC/P60 family protein [Salipiger mucosus]EPX82106.1 hypothetical protein Salmuc_02474 [Salipiger mucosus DSM 16094]
MSWANAYVGLPAGADAAGLPCWHLVRRVYREVLGIELPHYAGGQVCELERAELDRLITDAAASDWVESPQPAAFDVLLFRRARYRCHVGVAVDTRRMLHMPETGACIVDITQPRWAPRFLGAWTYRRAT